MGILTDVPPPCSTGHTKTISRSLPFTNAINHLRSDVFNTHRATQDDAMIE